MESRADLVATPEIALTGEGAALEDAYPEPPVRRFEALHFAVRNAKLVVGLAVVLAFLVAAIAGPWLTDATPFEFGYPLGEPADSQLFSERRKAGPWSAPGHRRDVGGDRRVGA